VRAPAPTLLPQRGAAGRLAAGAAIAVAADTALRARPPGGAARWERTNHRGRPVTLLEGPALAVAASLTATLPLASAALAGFGAAAVGAYDDAVGVRQPLAKGFRGHLAALRRGQVTTGTAKVAGIGLVATASVLLLEDLDDRRLLDVLVGAGVVAASANLLNLLDLRPGRALKAGLLAALVLRQPGPAAAAAALLPGDLRERTMLGDSGANAYGALLGLAIVDRGSRRSQALALSALVLLNAASELVSFSRVIDAVAPLRWVDRLGRLP
jgi:UDP-GlcNAc:undecaprenyl-phosphate GlcNAc-1-phosphate transferase